MLDSIEYRLIRSKRKTMSASVKDGILVVRAPVSLDKKEIETFIIKHKNWIEKQINKSLELKRIMEDDPGLTYEDIRCLADEALKVIPERVSFFSEKIGVSYGTITVRNQKTKWGSCSAKGNLNFNCLLMLAPREVLDSVIVHELCHRKYMNHSKEFYSEVLRVFPDYHKWDKWLRDNGGHLIMRMRKSGNALS